MRCFRDGCSKPRSGKSKYCEEHKAEARKRWLELIAEKPKKEDRAGEFAAILKQAHLAGVAAAERKTPTPMVVQQHANPLDDNSPVVKQYGPYEAGVCGFAWVNIRPATQAFARYIKERFDPRYHEKDGHPHGMRLVGIHAGDLDYYAGPSYYGGLDLSVGYYGQSYERKLAHAQAMAEVLKQHGIKCYATGRLD